MMNCHTFDVDIIINTLLTNTNINHVSIGRTIIEMTCVMKFYNGQKYLLLPWNTKQNLCFIIIPLRNIFIPA